MDLSKKIEETYKEIFGTNNVEVIEHKNNFVIEIFDKKNYAYLEGKVDFNERKYTINEIIVNHEFGELLYFSRILNKSEELARNLKLKHLVISPYLKSEISLLNDKNFQIINKEAIKNL